MRFASDSVGRARTAWSEYPLRRVIMGVCHATTSGRDPGHRSQLRSVPGIMEPDVWVSGVGTCRALELGDDGQDQRTRSGATIEDLGDGLLGTLHHIAILRRSLLPAIQHPA